MRECLPAVLLRVVFDCDLGSGELRWRERPKEMFDCELSYLDWNRRFAGKLVYLYPDKEGYLRFRLFGLKCSAHRVIWAWAHLRWPSGGLDHVNGDKSDNRLVNLREATPSQNSVNAPSRGGASRYRGVDFHRGRWRARCRFGGLRRDLGHFSTEEDAAKAYDRAALEMHGEFAFLNFPKLEGVGDGGF